MQRMWATNNRLVVFPGPSGTKRGQQTTNRKKRYMSLKNLSSCGDGTPCFFFRSKNIILLILNLLKCKSNVLMLIISFPLRTNKPRGKSLVYRSVTRRVNQEKVKETSSFEIVKGLSKSFNVMYRSAYFIYYLITVLTYLLKAKTFFFLALVILLSLCGSPTIS